MLFKNITMIDDQWEAVRRRYVGTQGDKITYIGDSMPEDPAIYGEQYDGTNRILLPGFVNAHAHSPMSVLRGYGEGLPLDRWLHERIFPFEAKLDGEAVYWSTLLSLAESLRFGIVSTSDMYMFHEDVIRAAVESGVKMNFARSVTNFAGYAPKDNPEFLAMKDALRHYQGAGEGRIRIDASVHAEYSNDEATLRAVSEAAAEEGARIHVHLSETEKETEECKERHDGRTPAAYLDSLGLFDRGGTAAHGVWLTPEDREILKARGMVVASNPVSNLKLCSGVCDVPSLYKAGVPVALGTDGPSSNNSLNFFEEMKIFALLGKMKSGDPAEMDPKEVLRSATCAGALAQGRTDSGCISKDFCADLIVVDASVPNMNPVHDILNNLVYAADGKDVCLTMVGGEVLYRDGNYTSIDLERVIAETERAKERILASL